MAKYIKHQDMQHVRGAPYDLMTQGTIERWHRSMKNVFRLGNDFLPSALEAALAKFVDYYHQERYHESIDNFTLADVYYGRAEEAPTRQDEIMRITLRESKRLHTQQLQRV